MVWGQGLPYPVLCPINMQKGTASRTPTGRGHVDGWPGCACYPVSLPRLYLRNLRNLWIHLRNLWTRDQRTQTIPMTAIIRPVFPSFFDEFAPRVRAMW